MQEPFDFPTYARVVRKFSRSLLGSAGSGAELAGFMHVLNTAVERDLARFGRCQESSRIACAPGCGDCCIVNVTVLFPEAVAISRFIARRFSPVDLQALRAAMQEVYRQTRWLDDEERLLLRTPCAFLDQQRCCMIHTVRPLLCRAVTSTDAQACQDAIALSALHGAPVVEMDLFQKRLMDTVFCELGGVLAALGADHRPFRLAAAVPALLEEPDLVSLFVSGEKVPIH